MRQRLEMAEVEPEPPGLHERTRLARVVAQPVSQDPVQDVCRRMSPLRASPARRVHARLHLVSDSQLARHDLHPVNDQPRHQALRIHHDRAAPGRGELAAVSNLATALRVEDGAVEHDLSLLTFGQKSRGGGSV